MGGKPSVEHQVDEDAKLQPVDLEKGTLVTTNGEEKKAADPRDKKGEKLNEEKMATMTPTRLLLYGASENNKEVVRSAREAGGDVNAPDTGPQLKPNEKPSNDAYANIITGNYPLHMAAENGHTEMITFLFHMEANLENKNKIGSTALHTAVSHQHLESVRELIKLGAKVSALNNMGNTPIHCAAYTGNVEIMETLLANGGTRFIHAKNKVEMTPMDYARKKQMADFLTNASVQSGIALPLPLTTSIPEEKATIEMKSQPITSPVERKHPESDDTSRHPTTPAELRASIDHLKQTLNIDGGETTTNTRQNRKKSMEDVPQSATATPTTTNPMLDDKMRALSESAIQVVFHNTAPGSPTTNPISP